MSSRSLYVWAGMYLSAAFLFMVLGVGSILEATETVAAPSPPTVGQGVVWCALALLYVFLGSVDLRRGDARRKAGE